MRAAQAKMPKRGSVRVEFIRGQQFRREALFPEQLAQQPKGRALVAAGVHPHVENLALVIDGAPQVHSLSGDADHHLVEMPPLAWSWAQASKSTGEPGPELQNPAPHRLVGNLHAPLGQKLFDIAVAQGKAE